MVRYNYWSSSAPVIWLRHTFGLEKPKAATAEGWKKWRQDYQKLNAFMHDVTEVWPNKLQNFVYWPADKLDALYYYINARFKDKYYSMQSVLEKGQYYEIDTRMLYCNFQALVNYVEIEYASRQIFSSNKEEQRELERTYGVKWYHKNRWVALFAPTWRSKKAGLDVFDRMCNLKIDEHYFGYNTGEMPQSEIDTCENFGQLSQQAINAQQVRDLYIWWDEIRPARPDSMDASGWSKILNEKLENSKINKTHFVDDLLDFSKQDPKEQEATKEMSRLDDSYEKEDQEQLIKLIEIRRSLWT